MLEKRIMTMNVLINAQRAKTELSTYSSQTGKHHIGKGEHKEIEHCYDNLNKIIKELSDELQL